MDKPLIIDTHTHIDAAPFREDFDAMIARAEEAGVSAWILPGADVEDLPKAAAICEQLPNAWFAVGAHPYHAEQYDEALFEQYAAHPKCAAIGECGLDYYRLPKDEEEKEKEIALQKEVFRNHIRLAKKLKLPLIVHIREASNDSMEILLEEGAGEVGGVLHCYNADHQLLKMAEHDFYFGIGGVLTFKNARKLVEVLPMIPVEKLVLETDAPYLTPHPFRGKRNEPAYTAYVAEKVGELLGMEYEEVCSTTTANAKRLFTALQGVAG